MPPNIDLSKVCMRNTSTALTRGGSPHSFHQTITHAQHAWRVHIVLHQQLAAPILDPCVNPSPSPHACSSTASPRNRASASLSSPSSSCVRACRAAVARCRAACAANSASLSEARSRRAVLSRVRLEDNVWLMASCRCGGWSVGQKRAEGCWIDMNWWDIKVSGGVRNQTFENGIWIPTKRCLGYHKGQIQLKLVVNSIKHLMLSTAEQKYILPSRTGGAWGRWIFIALISRQMQLPLNSCQVMFESSDRWVP